MRSSIIGAAAAVAFLPSVAAFLRASPLQQRSIRPTSRIALFPEVFETTSNLVAIVKENDVFVKQAGEYPWGSVQAPEWALPVAAIATLSFGVLIPLFLKPGVEAFNAGENAGRSKAVEVATVLKGGRVASKTIAKPVTVTPRRPASKTPISSSTTSSRKKAAPAAASPSKKWGLF